MRNINLTIVLVHYKCWSYLKENLISIQNQSVSIDQIIVINNDITTNLSQKLLAFKELPIRLISNDSNKGFASACNQAIPYIGKDALILFCNPDVKIPPTGIQDLVNTYHHSPFDILGCQQSQENGKPQKVYGSFPTLLTYIPIIGSVYKKKKSKHHLSCNSTIKVDWITGAVILISSIDFNTLGGFDEDYFMFMEDVDLCYRANKLGIQIGSTTKTHWIHHHGKSSVTDISDRIKSKTEAIISKHAYIKKHFGHKKIPGHIFLFIKYVPELFLALILNIILPIKEIKVRQKVALNLLSDASKALTKPYWGSKNG